MALTKRDTTTLTDSSPQPAEREESGSDGSFWFEDGNIILINAQRAGFRVHLDVLSMNADFFRDTSGMTLLQERGTEYYLLRVTDSTKDLMHFFHALYTRAYFYPGKPTHYDALESMLRLANKYSAHQLRADIVKHLTMIYPSKLAALEEHKDLRVPDHYSHSVRAIAMSREHDIPIILPAAFYFASTIPPAQLIDLHLKRDDVAVILSGKDKIAEDAFKIAWSWLFISSSGSRCSSVVQCQRRRLDVIQKLARSPGDAHRLFLNSIPHQYWQGEDKENGSESEDEVVGICNRCLREW
ncbi:hypothetical protein ARMSODRAFT_1086167 [Armillaria solidipes]|uniref:BTB domain-containing protein n=1 Tax=Armillaria solidipes TaxID=1076256 RepID=A0A2H3BJJ7_9AGAR|nr:hypothetical protein ARMSODRAFT_1086167 [Armillaria solidipes]